MDLNHQRASNHKFRVNDSGPPDIATTQASSQIMSSMTLKNRALNCCKSIFVNDSQNYLLHPHPGVPHNRWPFGLRFL